MEVEGQDYRGRFAEDLRLVPAVAKALAETAVAHRLTFPELARWRQGDFVPFGTAAKWTTALEAADEPTAVEPVESARLATSWGGVGVGKPDRDARSSA